MFLMKDVCIELFFIIKYENMPVTGIVLPQASFAGPRKLRNLKKIICHLESKYQLAITMTKAHEINVHNYHKTDRYI